MTGDRRSTYVASEVPAPREYESVDVTPGYKAALTALAVLSLVAGVVLGLIIGVQL